MVAVSKLYTHSRPVAVRQAGLPLGRDLGQSSSVQSALTRHHRDALSTSKEKSSSWVVSTVPMSVSCATASTASERTARSASPSSQRWNSARVSSGAAREGSGSPTSPTARRWRPPPDARVVGTLPRRCVLRLRPRPRRDALVGAQRAVRRCDDPDPYGGTPDRGQGGIRPGEGLAGYRGHASIGRRNVAKLSAASSSNASLVLSPGRTSVAGWLRGSATGTASCGPRVAT